MTVHGIDAASYQPAALDMGGAAFAFVKATESTSYINPHHASQVASVRAHGAVVGHYHFLHPGNITGQVNYFLAHAGWQTGDMLACDWESPNSGPPATDAEKNAFLAAVKKARPAARVLLYCNRDFWLNRDMHSVCGDGLWIADPSAPAGHPRVQHPWTFDQYGEVHGVDQNLGNFASFADLQHWAGVPMAKPAPAQHVPPAPVVTSSIDQRVTALESVVAKIRQKVGV